MADYKSTHTGEQIDTAIDNANSNWSALMANLGIGRWANQTFVSFSWNTQNNFYDNLAPYYSVTTRMFAYSKWSNNHPMILQMKSLNAGDYMFYGFENCDEIQLCNMTISWQNYMFAPSSFKRILVRDDCSVAIVGGAQYSFAYNNNLEELGAFDVSKMTESLHLENCGKLKKLHCKHWKVSLNISMSTAFEEADLVEIISNLDSVTTAQTLTMGATNLAKLTDEEKKVATDKGWVLA